MFNHCPPIELKDLKTENVNGNRYYVTPDGKYPSITTILGSFNKQKLYEWRQRVGAVEANRISSTAASKGTKVHSLCEKYLLNEDVDKKSTTIDAYHIFKSMLPLLNKINNIHYLECALYSNILKVAGRVDCIGEYDGVLSIIDFKTSSRIKTEDYIEDYFLQTTAYAMCYYELTGIKVKQIVIIMGVEHDFPLVFVKNINSYCETLVKKIKKFHSMS